MKIKIKPISGEIFSGLDGTEDLVEIIERL